MAERSRRLNSVVLVGLVAAVGLGVAVGVAVAPGARPDQLAVATGVVGEVPVTTQSGFVDRRTVDLLVDEGPNQSVRAPLGGRVTRLDCSVGRDLVSGESVFSIDGRRVVLLATASPMWRDLAIGNRGSDVRSLQKALKVEVTGRVDWATIAAANKLLAAAGAPKLVGGTIPLSVFAWLPGGQSRVAASCPVNLGQDVSAGDAMIELPPEILGARVREMPTDLTPGRRVVMVGDLRLPVETDGTIGNRRALVGA